MILGKRIRFRAAERTDIPRFLIWVNDPEVTAGLLISLPWAAAEEENWYEAMIKRPPPEHVLVIDVREGDGWLPIGSCGFHNLDWRVRSAELGIMIGEKSFWNQGFGTEAMELLLRHGFETLNLNRICLQVFSTNQRAIHVYEKIGFVHEGIQRQASYKNGQYVDVLWMSVLKSEYEGHKA